MDYDSHILDLSREVSVLSEKVDKIEHSIEELTKEVKTANESSKFAMDAIDDLIKKLLGNSQYEDKGDVLEIQEKQKSVDERLTKLENLRWLIIGGASIIGVLVAAIGVAIGYIMSHIDFSKIKNLFE